MEREVVADGEVHFRAAVVEGRDSAMRLGFVTAIEATHWVHKIDRKILAYQKRVFDECGRVGFTMKDQYVEAEN